MQINKKQMFRVGIIFSILLILILLVWGIVFVVQKIRVKYAKIEVTLQDNMSVNFLEEKKISDFIVSINGKIIKTQKTRHNRKFAINKSTKII